MTETEWRAFLEEFSRVLIKLDDWVECSESTRQRGYFEFVGAHEKDIIAAEERLDIAFPSSYRSFLKVSDGWPYMGPGCPGRLWSAENTTWFRDQEPEWLEIWLQPDPYGGRDISPEEHLYYRDVEEDDGRFREAYLSGTLAISEDDNAEILLLCPEVVDDNGEWECWHLWKSGAHRYRSFSAWMHSAYEFILNI